MHIETEDNIMEKYSLVNLGNCLNIIRRKRKLTQLEASTGIGINDRHYQRYESSDMPDMTVTKLFKILRFYKITLEELLEQGLE